MYLDIRTLSVSPNMEQRRIYDTYVKKACKKFDIISTISEGIRDKIGIPNIHILPLGSDCISANPKNYIDSIKLLYVGTFRGRELDKTIYGIKKFHELHPDIPFNYDIIGSGEKEQNELYINLVSELGLNNQVKFYGYIPHTELKPFFDRSNVGVSFIPLTDYYNKQPPTKTFEYILSGLFCIATATSSNRELIRETNGILIKDTAEAFCDALIKFWKLRNFICEKDIRDSLKYSTWKSIVEEKLSNILNFL
jgi:glycosyltransferase involved in cell wall biosynthesis